jgi:chlorophyll synthase
MATELLKVQQPLSLWKITLTLMKPYTWFAPAWAFVVGCIASHSIYFNLGEDVGHSILSLGHIAIGTFMAGPLLVGFSQVWNDWCDRDVDAINQPERLIPSGKATKAQVYTIVIALGVASLLVAWFLGPPVALVAAAGLFLAIIYSAEPFKLKKNGWIGNLAVGLAYESFAWISGHLTFDPGLQSPGAMQSMILAIVYGLGAHGIMTINDFKSVVGDRQMGLRSIPVIYGEAVAAKIAVATIVAAQVVAIMLQLVWGHWLPALACVVFLLAQIRPMKQLIDTPTQPMAVRYNIVAIPPYVWGMLVAAIGLG